jgi:hypothetical protein
MDFAVGVDMDMDMDMVSAWAVAKGAAAMARSEAKTIAVLRRVMAVSPGVSVVAGRIVHIFIFVSERTRLPAVQNFFE